MFEAIRYLLRAVFFLINRRRSLFGRTLQSPNPNADSITMKSAKKEHSKTEEQHQDLLTVKAEAESEEALKVCVGEDGFNVQIKEEPHSQEIGEEHSGDTSDCKSGTVTSESDIHQPEEYMKEERHLIHVKEEDELWLKEERDSEEADEREEESAGRQVLFTFFYSI